MGAGGACSVIFTYDFSYENGVFEWLVTAVVEKGLCAPNDPNKRRYIEPITQNSPPMAALDRPCLHRTPLDWCTPTSSYEKTKEDEPVLLS